MVTATEWREFRKAALIGVIVLIWIVALVLYWIVKIDQRSDLRTLASIILSYLVLWGVVWLCSDASKVELGKRFLLTSMSIAFIVGLIELTVLIKAVDFRLVFGTPIHEPWRNPNNDQDPRLLHIHKPYYRLVRNGIEYRYDRHGLRNESDLGTAEIIVVGDSIIEGWNVSAADLLTYHLAIQLDLTVANLGQSWYGPQQELELLRRHVLPLHPKVCVWVFFEGNDLLDVLRYDEAVEDWETFSKDFHSFEQRSFTKNSVLAVGRLLYSSNQRSVNETVGWENQSGVFQLSSGKMIRIYFLSAGHHLSEADKEALEQVRRIFSQAYELCRSAGAKFLVVFAPTKFRVYRNFTELETHAQPRYWVVNDLPESIEEIVRKELPSGAFLDLTPLFADEAGRGSLLYFPGLDTHWSPEGHRVAAAAIADFLARWEDKGVSK